ncbi:DUF1566 domain-containing protein [sulfur-oxidizing endosymbiont of Gigantopelta aegis]|uniref:Lcl domain-containing protein n=1 Tax=sulfur-oxidizing endosymbiont of Gigantopelta aegis TaxID=2794934 RepID=UPI0018DBA7A8|nr:DUF1566 domain-containing protein [sulfur-oxidizing endosymbiont of Gigantopelta aegis]
MKLKFRQNHIIIAMLFLLMATPISAAKKGIIVKGDQSIYDATKKLVNTEESVVKGCRKFEYIKDKILMRTTFLDLNWPKQNQHVKLRSNPKVVDEKEYLKILYQYNFFDNFTYKQGCFRNEIKQFSLALSKNKTKVVRIDKVTNLMWNEHYSDKLTLDEAKRILSSLNKENYLSYNDWRMPTLEEIASLYTDSGHVFRHSKVSAWVSDEFPDKDLHWVGGVRYNSSFVEPFETIKGNKVKIQKLKLLMVRNQPPPYPIPPSDFDEKDGLCEHWEQYNADQKLIRKPDSPEWPDNINSIKLRSTPIKYLNRSMTDFQIKEDTIKIDKGSLEYELSQIGFNFLYADVQCFKNYYIDVNADVLVDLATNLMWQKGSSRTISEYKHITKKEEYIIQLNKDNFNGFNDWRIPTTPEVSSLIEGTNYGKYKIHLNKLFNPNYTSFHVSDKFSYSDNLSREKEISVSAGKRRGIGLSQHRGKLIENIKAVRTLTAEEVQSYCQQKGVTCQ